MSRPNVSYASLDRLRPPRPVDRLDYLAGLCRGKRVLDIGCLDETAFVKRDTEHWLHGRIAAVAAHVVGVDSSSRIPDEGLVTAPNACILRGDGVEIAEAILARGPYDIAIAGEVLEHLESPLQFLRALRRQLPGVDFALSTPNATTFANALMGACGREVQHPDHLANFSYKILNTLCLRAGLSDWEIRPYRFYATEMILASQGAKRAAAQFTQGLIRTVEQVFPLLSFGYVVRTRL